VSFYPVSLPGGRHHCVRLSVRLAPLESLSLGPAAVAGPFLRPLAKSCYVHISSSFMGSFLRCSPVSFLPERHFYF